MEKWFVFGALLLLTACGVEDVTGNAVRGGAAIGDTVAVMYVGIDDEGVVFDTNKEAIAKENELHTEGRVYQPLQFVVGSGQMIPGFEQAVTGMEVGASKEVTLAPADAYGEYDETLVRTIPLPVTQEMPRTQEIPKEFVVPAEAFQQAFGADPMLNKLYESPQVPWSHEVTKISDDGVTIVAALEAGESVQLPDREYPSTVVDVTDEAIVLRHDPPADYSDEQIQSIEVKDDVLEVTFQTPVEGTLLTTPQGYVKVTEVREDEFVLDQNHPLAGKALTFTIELVDVTKGSTEGAQLPDLENV